MKTTNNFIEAVNQMFDDDEETDFAIEGEFRKLRTSRKIRMPGGLQRYERIYDPVDRYRVEVFRRVIDQITTSIIERFSNNHELVTDAVCFMPRREKQELSNELQSFILNFDSLSNALNEEYATTRDLESEQIRRNCLLCCFRILFKYYLHASAYTNLFLVYKYMLTLSFTQVSCERPFSKLKIVKPRLRSSLSNELLETFMLTSIEKDLLSKISVDDIIPFLVKKSTQFSRLLAV